MTEFQAAVEAFPAKLAQWQAMAHSWPEELRPYFAEAHVQGEGLQAPVFGVVVEAPESRATPEPQAQTEPPIMSGMVVANIAHLGMPKNAPAVDGVWEFQLGTTLSAKSAINLAETIIKMKNTGMAILQIRTADGILLDLDAYLESMGVKTPIRVNPTEFTAAARMRDLVR